MGLSSNVSLLGLTQKKTELEGKKLQNETEITSQATDVGVAQQTLSDTEKSLGHLRDLLKTTPQDNPEYTTLQGQINSETDPAKKAELEAQLAKIEKENPEYRELLEGIEKLEKEKLPADEVALETEKSEAEALDKTKEAIELDISEVEKQIQAEKAKLTSTDAEYEIEVTADRGQGGLTNEMYQMFEDMKSAGILNDVDEFTELSNSQKKALYQKLDEIQKGTEQSTNYSSMKAGDKFKYSSEQMLELAKAAGYDVAELKADDKILSAIEAPVFTVPQATIMPDKIELSGIVGDEPVVNAEDDKKVEQSASNIKLPRGIQWQGENKGTSLEDFGITASYENGEVVYTSSKGEKFNESQVNAYFRSIENNVDPSYSKLLDKAEKLGVDYTSCNSVDDLKAAIKEQKALDKKAEKAEKEETVKKEEVVQKETPVSNEENEPKEEVVSNETSVSTVSTADKKRAEQVAEYKSQLEAYGVSTIYRGSQDEATEAIVLKMRLQTIQREAESFIKQHKDEIKESGIDTTNKTADKIKAELEEYKALLEVMKK